MSPPPVNRRRLLAVPFLLELFHETSAQVGVTICACQPDFYEFTLNFSLICADMDVTPGQPGILDTACQVDTPGRDNVTDFKPVTISKVQVVELDQNFQVIYQANYDMVFIDGQTFNYSSITKTMPMLLNDTSVPSAIQLSIFGRNAAEEDLLNFWSIEYNNLCGIWPLLYEGQRAGWTIFSDLGTPSSFICPAVPTEQPAFFPSDSPSQSPTIDTHAPTKAALQPSPYPTFSPTSCPPTLAPIESVRHLTREAKDRYLMTGIKCIPSLPPAPTSFPTCQPIDVIRRLAIGNTRGSVDRQEYDRLLKTGQRCHNQDLLDGLFSGGSKRNPSSSPAPDRAGKMAGHLDDMAPNFFAQPVHPPIGKKKLPSHKSKMAKNKRPKSKNSPKAMSAAEGMAMMK